MKEEVICPNCGEGVPMPSDDVYRAMIGGLYEQAIGDAERLREALVDIRAATNYDNCCGQLKKIEKITEAALEQSDRGATVPEVE